eukprot:1963721-Pleurochrysis_carterae.AAC.1
MQLTLPTALRTRTWQFCSMNGGRRPLEGSLRSVLISRVAICCSIFYLVSSVAADTLPPT